MFDAISSFVSPQKGDSGEFVGKVRGLAIGVARDYEPARMYVVRIDNWFGPRWLKFAGKFTAGKGFAVGIHKTRLHVPPFVPQRVVAERVVAGPDYDFTVDAPALHIECPSKLALRRRIVDIDKDAAFLWFSGESEVQKRGAAMVYLPVGPDPTTNRKGGLRGGGAFYAGFSRREISWEPVMLRGISLNELAYFDERGLEAGELIVA